MCDGWFIKNQDAFFFVFASLNLIRWPNGSVWDRFSWLKALEFNEFNNFSIFNQALTWIPQPFHTLLYKMLLRCKTQKTECCVELWLDSYILYTCTCVEQLLRHMNVSAETDSMWLRKWLLDSFGLVSILIIVPLIAHQPSHVQCKIIEVKGQSSYRE